MSGPRWRAAGAASSTDSCSSTRPVVSTVAHRGVPHAHLADQPGQQPAQRLVGVVVDVDPIGSSSWASETRAAHRTISPVSQTWCSTIRVSRSMEVTLSRAGSRRLPGGWKCTPLGRLDQDRTARAARDSPRPPPYARANARVRHLEPYPASTATSSTGGRCEEPVRRAFEQHSAPEPPWRFTGRRRDHPVEMEAGQVQAARELLAGGARGRRGCRRAHPRRPGTCRARWTVLRSWPDRPPAWPCRLIGLAAVLGSCAQTACGSAPRLAVRATGRLLPSVPGRQRRGRVGDGAGGRRRGRCSRRATCTRRPGGASRSRSVSSARLRPTAWCAPAPTWWTRPTGRRRDARTARCSRRCARPRRWWWWPVCSTPGGGSRWRWTRSSAEHSQ